MGTFRSRFFHVERGCVGSKSREDLVEGQIPICISLTLELNRPRSLNLIYTEKFIVSPRVY